MKHFLFLSNIFSLMLLTGLAIIGTFQARVTNHDNPEHAIVISLIAGIALLLVPLWTAIKYCLCPEQRLELPTNIHNATREYVRQHLPEWDEKIRQRRVERLEEN